MPEEQSGASGLRFRLPRVFSETTQSKENATGAAKETPKPDSTAKPPTPRGSGTPVQVTQPGMANSQHTPGAGPITPTILSQQIASQTGQIADEVAALRADIELLQQAFVEITERESNQEKVFNVLHNELREYKNDFIYEHLKPVIRPLLFLFDSMEQFEQELQPSVLAQDATATQPLSAKLVDDNVRFFLDQLIEALRVCEVTLMDRPQGPFDPKLHKAVEVVAVPPELDNTIQRVVQAGWYLRGHLFRPAEVIVGTFIPHAV